MRVKLNYYPIAFTRPYEELLDYQFFVCPAPFREKIEALESARTFISNCVIATYDEGRWCIYRISDKYLLCGMATLKHNRFDEYGRGPICGFYGVVIEMAYSFNSSICSVAIPTEKYFDWIDGEYVTPHFQDKQVECKYSVCMDNGSCQKLMRIVSDEDFDKYDLKRIIEGWNKEQDKVMFFPQNQFDLEMDLVLFGGIKAAVKSKSFNFITQVTGSFDGCSRLGILNAFSPNEASIRLVEEGGKCPSVSGHPKADVPIATKSHFKLFLFSALGVIVLITLIALLSNTKADANEAIFPCGH